MKVKDLIARLQQYDPEAVVLLADWSEDYSSPSEQAAERIKQYDGRKRQRVIIGGDADDA